MSEMELQRAMEGLVGEIRLLRLELDGLRRVVESGTIRNKNLNMAEACEFLKISRTTMHKRLSCGEITFAVKKGKSWLFPEDGLKRYASGLI